MPRWGLTKEQRDKEPWDIPREWLEPSKVITDPIHGDIYLTRLERALIDSSPFQRLRRIRQLGNVHLVYPGATHSRFSHALGALRVVQDLLDIVLDQRSSRRPEPDLFLDLEDGLGEGDFQRKVAEVVVLARLGTLLHDLCHVAYGHTIEDELRLLDPHDANSRRFEHFWSRLGDGEPRKERRELRAFLDSKPLKPALRPLILSKEERDGKRIRPEDELIAHGAYPFIADMVGNTICADLLDYLARDHRFAGLPAALGQRFMTAFYVVPEQRDDEAAPYAARMALRLAPRGRERSDIVSELLKHLRFRYELQERVIVHHAKLAADVMLGKLLSRWSDALWIQHASAIGGSAFQRQLGENPLDAERLREVLGDAIGPKALKKLDGQVRREIERRVRWKGDDALLEFLSSEDWSTQLTDVPLAATAAVRQLADDLINRRLFKRAARAQPKAKKTIYDEFGRDPAGRRDLERQAADYAGIPEDHIGLWLPDPKMHLKIADVLVDYERGIVPFSEYSDKGRDIYEAHRSLWAIHVYVHPRIHGTQKEAAALARLAQLMGIEWDRHVPRKATQPSDWPAAREAEVALGDDPFDQALTDLLRDAHSLAQRGENVTFKDNLARLRPRARRIKKLREDS